MGVSTSFTSVEASRATAPARAPAWRGWAATSMPWRTAARPALAPSGHAADERRGERSAGPPAREGSRQRSPGSGRRCRGRLRAGAALRLARRVVSVSDSITRPRAIPSAMQWCMREITAHPSPRPSTRYRFQSGRERSSGVAIRSPTSSFSAVSSPGAGSARWWMWCSSAKSGSSSQEGTSSGRRLSTTRWRKRG